MEEDDLAAHGQEFRTVGHLYRSIEAGFRQLVERFGEEWVFVGPPKAQATPETFRWPELVAVTDLASACAAIETIVEQGEGPRGEWRDAHYGRFHQVFEEYMAHKAADPDFEPARPVLAVSVRPAYDAETGVLVTDPMTRRVLDLFNVGYEVLLQLLTRFFGHGSETTAELQVLADAAVNLMYGIIKPLGMAVTALAVGPELPGCTAGASFELFYGTGYLLPHKRAAWILYHERLSQLATACEWVARLPGAPATELSAGSDALLAIAATLAAHLPELAGRPL